MGEEFGQISCQGLWLSEATEEGGVWCLREYLCAAGADQGSWSLDPGSEHQEAPMSAVTAACWIWGVQLNSSPHFGVRILVALMLLKPEVLVDQ